METAEEARGKNKDAARDGGITIESATVVDGHNGASSNGQALDVRDTVTGTPRIVSPWLPQRDVERATPQPSTPSTINAQPSTETQTGLPPMPAGADLAPATVKKRWLALCFGLSFVIYALFIPRVVLYSSPPAGDQPYYLMDTISLIQDGDLDLANNYANHEEDLFYKLAPHPTNFMGMEFVGLIAPYPLPQMLAVATDRPNTERYSYHLPGLSVLLIPAWMIGGLFKLWWPATVVFMCILGALVGMNVFLLAHQLTGKLWIAWAVWFPIAFSNPIMSYTYLIFTELPTGLLLLYAFRRLAMGWRANGPWRILLIGLCIATIPWLAWRCVLIAAFLGLYAFVQWWRARKVPVTRRQGSNQKSEDRNQKTEIRDQAPPFWKHALSFAWLSLPVVLAGGSMLWYNMFLYGRPIPDSSTLEQGRTAIFHWPWGGEEELSLFLMAAFGQFFDRQFGLLIYAPIYLLAIVGFIAMFRLGRAADRRLALWIALFIVPYLFVITAFDSWHGVWSPPSRYWASFVPLLGAPLAMSLFALAKNWGYKALYALLILPGLGFMAVILNDPRLFWPWVGGPGTVMNWIATSPQSPVKYDLRNVVPNFVKPDDMRHPTMTALYIGAAALIVLLCYFLMTRQGVLRGLRGWSTPARAALLVGCLAIVSAGWTGMNYQYIKHNTTLTQTHRWDLNPDLLRPGGIAYLDGKVYLPEYGVQQATGGVSNGFVYEIDTRTGEQKMVEPRSANGEPLQFAHPADVKAGPDGLLYVLNNGEGIDGLWAMKPDGEVVKRIELQGKTVAATGLNIDPTGHFYVADMMGGMISKYGQDGGPQLGLFGGERGGFNNPQGVAVDRDGNIYATEGYQLLQKMDPNGNWEASYRLRCQPTYLMARDNWLDIACERTFLSLNLDTGEFQRSRFGSEIPPLEYPYGIAYGPNDMLYILDNSVFGQSTLVEYRAQR